MSENKPLKIIGFHASNVMAVKAVEIYPDKKDVVILTGTNKQGKSSIIRAIYAALAGKKFIPDDILRRGEKKGSVSLDLGDFVVTLNITPKGETLKVVTKDGMRPTGGVQGFLSSRLGGLAHNPLEFMRLKPAEQVKIVQGLFPLNVDAKEVERVAGSTARVHTMGDNKILYLDQVSDSLFEERTIVNREIKRLEGVIESTIIPAELQDIEKVKVSELFAERKALEETKRKNDQIRANAEALSTKLGDISVNIVNKDDEIRELEERLFALKEEKRALINTRIDIQVQYTSESEIVAALIEPDFTEIDEKIARADEINKDHAKAEQLRETLKKAKEDHESSQKESSELTEQIDKLKAYKLKLIEQAQLPLPALGFANGELTYNGLPLEVASTRKQIEISCAICLAQHPRIGVITIDRWWSDLDESGKKSIRDFAQKAGAQIWVTVVAEGPGSDGFHIVDGELTAVDGVPLEEDVA